MEALIKFIRDLGAVKIAVMLSVVLLVIIGLTFVSMRLSSPSLSPLYKNLDGKEVGEIITVLGSRGIPYALEDNGSTILVPKEKILNLRMVMAAEGLPSQGSIVGYEIFDEAEALGTSNFLNNVKLLRALEGELGRTITTFSQVKSARVHLVIPKKELFSREKREPRASVTLDIKGGKELSKEQIRSIGYLVAAAVPNLTFHNITIVDTIGNALKLGVEDSDDPGIITSNADEYRVSFERRLKQIAERALEKVVGVGRVNVDISAEIDFDRVVTNTETFDPDGQVVRSVQTIEERENSLDSNPNQNVSVANNLPNADTSASGPSSNSSVERIDETTNFEISKTVRNHVSETGTIKRLSISVLVDGKYVEDAQALNLLGTADLVYQERDQEELDKMAALVKSAVGFDTTRGDVIEVVNMQFTTKVKRPKKEQPFDWVKNEFQNILQTLVIGVVVILIMLLVVRPMVNRAFEFTKGEEEVEEFQAVLTGDEAEEQLMEFEEEEEETEQMIDIERMEARVKTSTIEKINDVVGSNPEEAVALIRSWLTR